MPTVRVLTEYREMAWKNGLGKSSELVILPPHTDFSSSQFIFRISTSTVKYSTSFSVFPGYDRTSVRLKGDNLLLKHNLSAKVTSVAPLEPYSFKGEWQTEELVKSEATDLHIICRRDKAKADVHVLNVTPDGDTSITLDCQSSNYIYCTQSSALVHIGTKTGHTVLLHEGHTLELSVLEEEDSFPIFFEPYTPSEEEGKGGEEAKEKEQQQPEEKQKERVNATLVVIQVASIGNGEETPRTHEEVDRVTSLPNISLTYDMSALWKIWSLGEEEAASSSQALSPPVQHQQKSLTNMRKMMRANSVVFEQAGPAQRYVPPSLRSRFRAESEAPPAETKDSLDIRDFPKGEVRSAWINMFRSGLSDWVRVPVLVARGREEGPVLGVTAAVHGNELNGVPCIHRVISAIDVNVLKGTVVGVPCVNITGYLNCTRTFMDGVDLNRRFPGNKNGLPSDIFCANFMEKIVKPNFTHLIDLHTASFGRINSYYVRADLNDEDSKHMALLQGPQIVLHDGGHSGTLRGAASALGIKAITVEIGNPQQLQDKLVQWSTAGIMNVMDYYNMFSIEHKQETCRRPTICNHGYWMYTKGGGLLEVYPGVNMLVKKGDLVARLKNIFGNYIETYFAEHDGVVIGRSSNPVASAGSRILHLGLVYDGKSPLGAAGHENY
ncbi:Succinylglutamate desuccinylase/aspartoacylase [Balamuthia mandrillaris]